MKKVIAVAVLVAFLLATAAVAVPRPVAAQVMGPWADEIVFSIVPQPQAVLSVSSGDTDVYIFGLDLASDVRSARDDPNVITYETTGGGVRSLQFNPVPHGPTVPGFNPFTIQAIREAMYWAVDRAVIVNDVYEGLGTKMWTAFSSGEPTFVRDAAFFVTLEAFYDYDPQKALDVVTAEMAKVPGSALVNGKWQVDGAPVVVKIFHRTGDPRFEVGIYVATRVDALGFTSQLVPGDFPAARVGPLFGDPTAGDWHIYTGGWGGGGFVQFDDTTAPFFYNGDLGVSLWDFYTPPASLTIPCDRLEISDYVDLDERRDLLRACVSEGLKDGIRHFLKADLDVVITNSATTNPTVNLAASFLNSFSMKTARKDGVVGGTLQIGQPIHTLSAWNNWGGFTDVYSENQHQQFSDVGAANHPHLGTTIPFRSEFVIETVAPSTMDVPEDAQRWDVATSQFVDVGAGLETRSKVTYTYNWGSWHHGMPITMDDVLSNLMMIFRFGDDAGDLGILSPSVHDLTGIQIFMDQFKGFKVLDADTLVVWIDSWNPDTTLIAGDGDIWPEYPWELNAVMSRSVIDNGTEFHDTDALAVQNDALDLVKGPGLVSLSDALTSLSTVNFIPAGLEGNITTAEATARWAALNDWWTAKGHLMVTDGPFFVDSISTTPQGTVLKAFRTGYPFDVNKWDAFATIRVPEVIIGPAPEVIQTFPATFGFTTTLVGQPYDLIGQANWLVSDPATREVLFIGDAVRSGVGTWDVTLSAEQTTALTEGTYELKTIVVGTEAGLPVVTTKTFTSLSLSTAILAELSDILNTRLAEFEDTLSSAAATADSAVAAADAAIALTQVVLTVAIVAIIIAAVAVVLVLRRPKT